MSLRVATWNINSVRIRLHLLQRLASEESPDIVCLQEIKVENGLFPHEAVAALGYKHACVHGQKGYHGVAILSRVPLSDVFSLGLLDAGQSRHIAARLEDGTEIHNVYIPAGGDIPDRELNPYYGFKLDYVSALNEWFTRERSAQVKQGKRLILTGDFNIAPQEHDVWSHRQLLNVVSHTPAEVERLNALQAAQGWVDSARLFTPPEEKLYSWWSYRNRDWRKSNRGRRLDHLWLSPGLAPALKSVKTLTDARDWERGSDHVPIVAEFT